MNHLLKELLNSSDDVARLRSELLIAAAMNGVFLGLILLLLLPLGKVMFALQLAKGYAFFWMITIIVIVIFGAIQIWLRLSIYNRYRAFLFSNFLPSTYLVMGWSAFAAFTVQSFAATTSRWIIAILYLVGFLSSYFAFNVIAPFFTGELYRIVNGILALISFVVFAIWPQGGRFLYGWFFNLV